MKRFICFQWMGPYSGYSCFIWTPGSYKVSSLYQTVIHRNANDNIRKDKNKCQWKFLAEIQLLSQLCPLWWPFAPHYKCSLVPLTFHIPNPNMLFVYLDVCVPCFVVGFEVAFQFIPRILKYKLEDLGLDTEDLFLTY